MMDFTHLCMGCMEEKGPDSICQYCGYKEGTAPESLLHLPPGTKLQDKSLLGRVLGHGGFGITYLAWDTDLNIKLAIKEYLPQQLATRTLGQSTVTAYKSTLSDAFNYGLGKFLEEARTLARFIEHPGIVSVRDFFKANGTAYLVMNFYEGITLQTYLESKGGKISTEQALNIFMPVLDALKEVHAAGILHRDISPDNLLISTRGQVVLIDFGAARQAMGKKSKNLSVIMKAGYSPEEQYRTKGEQGPWTDIYAVAATFYRAITGQLPPESLDRLAETKLVPPSELEVEVTPYQEKALLKALAVKAQDRYQSVDDFQEELLSGKDVIVEEYDESPLIYEVSVAEVVAGTAAVTAEPASAVEKGVTVSVNIADIEEGKQFALIDVAGDESGARVKALEINEGRSYSFEMPGENVTVTVTLEDEPPLIYEVSEELETPEEKEEPAAAVVAFAQIVKDKLSFTGRNKIAAIAGLVIVLGFLLVGGIILFSGEKLSPEEVLAKSIEATSEANSFVFEMDIIQEIKIPGHDDMERETNASGTLIEEPMTSEIDMEIDLVGFKVPLKSYLADNIHYVSIPLLGEVIEEDMNKDGFLTHLYDYHFGCINTLAVVDPDNVIMKKKGDYYLLTYKDITGALADLIKEQAKGVLDAGLLENLGIEDHSGDIKISALEYSMSIDRNSFLPSENTLAFEMTIEVSDGTMNIEQVADISYMEFGIFESITVPDELTDETVPFEEFYTTFFNE